MGREIRWAPPGWEHPKYTEETAQASGRYDRVGQLHPMHDAPYADACADWLAEFAKWQAGERPSYFDASKYPADIQYWEWDSGPPERAYYREREWAEGEATACAVYETVSEGTPVTPFFNTPDELVDYLATHGDFWDQKRGDGPWGRAAAEAFVRRGWSPSMAITNGAVIEPKDPAMYQMIGEAT